MSHHISPATSINTASTKVERQPSNPAPQRAKHNEKTTMSTHVQAAIKRDVATQALAFAKTQQEQGVPGYEFGGKPIEHPATALTCIAKVAIQSDADLSPFASQSIRNICAFRPEEKETALAREVEWAVNCAVRLYLEQLKYAIGKADVAFAPDGRPIASALRAPGIVTVLCSQETPQLVGRLVKGAGFIVDGEHGGTISLIIGMDDDAAARELIAQLPALLAPRNSVPSMPNYVDEPL